MKSMRKHIIACAIVAALFWMSFGIGWWMRGWVSDETGEIVEFSIICLNSKHPKVRSIGAREIVRLWRSARGRVEVGKRLDVLRQIVEDAGHEMSGEDVDLIRRICE
jgi:hypothetical protein